MVNHVNKEKSMDTKRKVIRLVTGLLILALVLLLVQLGALLAKAAPDPAINVFVFDGKPADLVINEIMRDPAAVDDSAGEWFELYNADTVPVNLDGWTIGDGDSDSHVISSTLLVAPGRYLVLGCNGDFVTNGGVDVDYAYSGFFLDNTDDEIVLLDSWGREVDRVGYDDSNFPNPTGASMELIDPALSNDEGDNWQAATVPYGDGDLGTPGGPNDLPAVISTVPEDGAAGVSLGVVITATFSEGMDVTTVTSDTFTLGPESGPPVEGDFSYNDGSNTLTFVPTADLAPSTTYTATIAGSVTNQAGTPMGDDYAWSFITSGGALPGTITVVKKTDPEGGMGFSFTGTGGLGGFSLDDGESQTFPNLLAGDYTVTETVPAGWYLGNVVCTGGDSTPIDNGVTIHLDAGEDITCTFPNIQRGSITIVKYTDPGSDTGFSFTGSGGFGGFSLRDGESQVFDDLLAGDYTVTETVPADWELDSVVCTGGDSAPVANGVTVHLDVGEDITCTFTNKQDPSVIELVSFTATPGKGTVTLAWETGTEVDNAGFNLYRATAGAGPYTRINGALIPAEGDAVSGASYSFLDTPGYGIFYYQLEDVDYYGVSTLHGPAKVKVLRLFLPPLPWPMPLR